MIKITRMRRQIIQNGNSQALRIPQEMKTDEKEYCINKIGDIYIAYPASDPWAAARQVIGTFPDDFGNDRQQPSWSDVSEQEEL